MERDSAQLDGVKKMPPEEMTEDLNGFSTLAEARGGVDNPKQRWHTDPDLCFRVSGT